ncbi:MAG: tRNA lysidine(34) synthetase TilS [Limisphaerales bacterium]
MADPVRQVGEWIRRKTLLRRGQSVLVAVSGGVDSMALLHILHQLSRVGQWRLVVAHFNHQLRGRASDADERLVVQTAQRLGWRCVVDRADVRRHARREGVSLEMAARRLRHDFLARAARRLKIDTIATAHHADDQVELFFLRLLRGTTGAGLAGMKWESPSPGNPAVRLVRPLLNRRKAALRAFAQAEGITFREDATNQQTDALRNRVRNELLPLLTARYQPALAKSVLRLMDVGGEESDQVGRLACRWLARKRRSGFDRLSIAVQRQCVQRQLIGLGTGPEFDLVERLRERPNEPVSVGAERAVFRDAAGTIHRVPPTRTRFRSGQQRIAVSDDRGDATFDGLRIRWRIGRAPGSLSRSRRAITGCERFDADKIGGRVLLRHWRRGDRFQPIGLPTPAKLQDLFTNQKIPRHRRHELVVAVAGNGELFWVEGLRISERFKLDRRTRRCLAWRWVRAQSAGGPDEPA